MAEAASSRDSSPGAVHRTEHPLTTRFRHVAPAGAPIRASDLARWARVAASPTDASEKLRAAFRTRFGVRHSFLTSTGRAGLTLLLRAMRRLAPAARDEVVLPSYTCYSVAASVVKAGLKARVVDISPATLDYQMDRLARTDFSRVLAMISTNLYGLPNDMPALAEVARTHGVFLIDDAAQAMGASVGNRLSGTWADAGLFSLDKGKNVSAMDGGVLVTNSDRVAAALRDELTGLSAPSLVESGMGVAKALAYCALLRPRLYWIPNGIPQLGLGQTHFTTAYALQQPSRSLVTLALAVMERLDESTAVRVTNAAALSAALRTITGVRMVSLAPTANPVYLRFPILAADADQRRRVLARLEAAGIGATGSYPASLADIPQLRPFMAGDTTDAEGGRHVAERIITLPTHPFVQAADIRETASVIAAALDATAAGVKQQ